MIYAGYTSGRNVTVTAAGVLFWVNCSLYLTDYGQVQLDVLGGRVSVVDPTPVDPLVLTNGDRDTV